MPRRTKRSRQSRTANPTGKRARYTSPPTPQPDSAPAPQPDSAPAPLHPPELLQPPTAFENPSAATSNEVEGQADLEGDASVHAQAVASEEAQNALDQAEEEAFSVSDSDSEGG